MPPKSWVDKDTGHRLWRVSDEPNSGALLFQRQRLHARPQADGLQLAGRHPRARSGYDDDRMLVPNLARARRCQDARLRQAGPEALRDGVRAIVVGHKTDSVFFTRMDPDAQPMRSTRRTPTPAR